ncbi:hypothetical protein TNCV_1544791 [Trichonephila clavipes]|nr:hypothetical protein TNCV_1544791 [Trichonephila clavipes]
MSPPNPLGPPIQNANQSPFRSRVNEAACRDCRKAAEVAKLLELSLFLTFLVPQKKHQKKAQYSNTHYRLFHVKLRSWSHKAC